MRLPLIDNEFSNVNKDIVSEMFDLFLERGFRYVDTAWFYHNGNSERVIRECLVERSAREAFQFADKMLVVLLKNELELSEYFDRQLERGSVDFENGKVKLPKLKMVRAKLHREFSGQIKSATVSQAPSGKYYVSILIETEHEELPHTKKNIGLDLGIKDLCITSDGYRYENPKSIKKVGFRIWLWRFPQKARLMNGWSQCLQRNMRCYINAKQEI